MTDDILYKLNLLHQLVAAENTGTPEELARKLRVSKRAAHKYIKLLKKQGAPISFCRRRKSYYYTAYGEFHFVFHRTSIDENLV